MGTGVRGATLRLRARAPSRPKVVTGCISRTLAGVLLSRRQSGIYAAIRGTR
jgi:hypothetical protein